MGFKSVMKKIGKVALKVAPYAAMAIPGVGIPLGMAISGASSAASKKIAGGSWKDALISGGIGAGTAAIGGKIPIKGIGPSSSAVSKSVANVASKATGEGGFKAGLGNVLKGAIGGIGVPGVAGKGAQGALGSAIGSEIMGSVANRGQSNPNPYRTPDYNPSVGGAVSRPAAGTGGGAMPKGGFRYSENPMNQYDQSSPNLSQSIFQGRQEAIRNQPFRKGYDVKTLTGYEDDDTTKPTYSYSSMPRIMSDRPDQRKKKVSAFQPTEPVDTEQVPVRGGGAKRRTPRELAY